MDVSEGLGTGAQVEVTGDMILSWRAQACGLPLPDYIVPRSGAPLANVEDDALLNAPPHILAHIMRTAAQGGLQIISPRQVPFSSLMIRREGTDRMLGDHDVGSIADPKAWWPTVDGETFDHLLPDEPVMPFSQEAVKHEKTKLISLTRFSSEMSDPVLACLIKGRAVVDLLSREDVNGGAVEMATLISEAWGISVDELMELEAYSLGIDGPLQRHAMKADDVYPTLYAPIHARTCISMGTSDVSKDLMMSDTAMDWRRLRTYCEAVFYNTCVLEGYPIRYMKGVTAPGDPGGLANKPNTMTFYPAPCIAWTYAPYTFSLMPKPHLGVGARSTIPPEIRAALQRHVKRVRPISHLLTEGKPVALKQTVATEGRAADGDAIRSAYTRLMRSMHVGASRGRTASATVRNYLYDSILGAEPAIRLKMSRYLDITVNECRVHLDTRIVPDRVIEHLAKCYHEVGSMIHDRVTREAVLRGIEAEEWWEAFIAQCPPRYADYGMTVRGWCMAAFWCLFREPTDKWVNLKRGLRHKAIRDAELSSIGAIPLPPERGSGERLMAAADATVKRLSQAFAGHYSGVADVGHAVAEAASEMGRTRTASVLREGAHLWSLRARALRGLNAHVIAKSESTPSQNHMRVAAEPVDILLKPSPYMAVKAWLAHVGQSSMISPSVKRELRGAEHEVLSEMFTSMSRSILACKDSKVTQYLLRPRELGEDLERGWGYLVEDVRRMVFILQAEEKKTREAQQVVTIDEAPAFMFEPAGPPVVSRSQGEGSTFWEVYGQMDIDTVDWVDSVLNRMPPDMQEDIRHRRYESEDALVAAMEDEEEDMTVAETNAGEAVR